MPKVLMLNGSPHREGCTYTALAEAASVLSREGVDSEIVWVGTVPVASCTACGFCAKNGRCVFDDAVNDFVARARTVDGFLFGSPVHYAGPSGAITAFLGRAFYSGSSAFANKPGAVVASCRRGGATATFQQLSMYLNRMITVPTQYWGIVHGNSPAEVRQDAEGMQTMRTLGANMAYLIRALDCAKNAGIVPPTPEMRVATNFIRG
ncbi:MAG: flavodoxin family protein [Clostridiaceae bacterium]|nr:flavodoxin family protein [Clostridiaceae bacterium]